MKRLFVIIVATLLVTSFAMADNTVSSASAQLIQAITLDNKGTTLNFGKIMIYDGTNQGWCELHTDASRVFDGSYLKTGGVSTPAVSVPIYNVGGKEGLYYTVQVATGGAFTLDIDGAGTNSINVSISNINFGPGEVVYVDGTSAGVLDGNGAGTFTLGAILSVPAGTPVGQYHGTFNVTVQYQ